MFMTTKEVRETVKKTRRIHAGAGQVVAVVFKADNVQTLKDLVLVHSESPTGPFVFLQKETHKSFVMHNGHIGTLQVDWLFHDVDGDFEKRVTINTSMKYEVEKLETVRKEVEIKEGEYIDIFVGDNDLVSLKVIYCAGTKLVLIDEDTEEVYEVTPEEFPSRFCPVYELNWVEH